MSIDIEKVNILLSEGKSFRQIAKLLKMPEGTFHTRLRKAGYAAGKTLIPIHPQESIKR